MSVVVAALYRFAPLDDLPALKTALLETMRKHDVLGTLLIAEEGINGTISGSRTGLDAVLKVARAQPGLADLEPRESTAPQAPFGKARVKIKPEIVSFGRAVDPRGEVGEYVDPEDWDELIQRPDVKLIDCRNVYEINLGTFEGAIDPETDSFREFPDYVESELDPARDEAVAMFCTGGIRCEKATSYMRRLGFRNVYHLKGGILNYLERVDPARSSWRGECFVFDDRVTVDHDLIPGNHEICPNCRMPILPGEKDLPEFEENFSCVRCHHRLTPERRAALAERRRQRTLAEAGS